MGRFFCNINNKHFENSPPVFQLGYVQKINAIPYMFCDACTDCYILYRVRQYLIAFLGIFIFVGCVAVGAVFADLCNKKRNSQKKSNCFSSILLHRGYNPNHPHKLQKAAVSQSDSPTQRPFCNLPPDFYNLPHPSWNNRAFCAIFFTGKGVRT